MKKQNWKELLLICMLMLVCSAHSTAKDRYPIERGMSKQEVRNILGKPRTSSFDSFIERWEYVKLQGNLLNGRYVRIIVDFDRSDKVVRFQTVELPSSEVNSREYVVPLPRYDGYYGEMYPSEEYPLSEKEFSVLYEKVKKTAFDDGKLDLIEVASIRCCYTCAQCAALMELFSFTDNKFSALTLMSPRIVDPRNVYSILQIFSFESEKERASRIIRDR